jgi:hypothetical protein
MRAKTIFDYSIFQDRTRPPSLLKRYFRGKERPVWEGRMDVVASAALCRASLRAAAIIESKGERWEAIMLPPTLCNGVLLRGRDSRWITGSGARLCRL